jgi:hypothetical protein
MADSTEGGASPRRRPIHTTWAEYLEARERGTLQARPPVRNDGKQRRFVLRVAATETLWREILERIYAAQPDLIWSTADWLPVLDHPDFEPILEIRASGIDNVELSVSGWDEAAIEAPQDYLDKEDKKNRDDEE